MSLREANPWRDERGSVGVPAALGLDTREWVEQYVGGWVRLPVDDRRAAVKELSSEGHKPVEIADVLGVSDDTVRRDLAASAAEEAPAPERHEADLAASAAPEPVHLHTAGPAELAAMEAMDAELPTLRKAAAALPETDKGFRSTVDQVLAMLVWLDPENNQPITEVKIEQARRRRHSAASGSEYDASHA